MKHTLKRSLALLLVLLFAIPTFAFAEDLDLDVVSVEDIEMVEDVVADDVVVEQEETEVKEEVLDLGNEVKDEEIAEDNEAEIAEANAESFTVIFDAGEGATFVPGDNNVSDIQTVTSGQPVGQPGDPTRYGYTFVNWCVNDTDTVWNFSDGVTADMTLKAKWAARTVTVRFMDPVVNEQLYSAEVAFGDTPAKPADPTAAGRLFDAWYTQTEVMDADTEFYFADTKVKNEDGTTTEHKKMTLSTKDFSTIFDASKPFPESFYLYAGWTQELTVKFFAEKANPATDAPLATQTVKSDKFATKPADTLAPAPEAGKKLGGWCQDPTAPVAFDFDKTKITEDIADEDGVVNLFAFYEDIKYVVTYELTPGVTVDIADSLETNTDGKLYEEVAFGKKATEAKASMPEASSYKFVGWFTDPDLTKAFSYDAELTGNVTLYPSFKKAFHVTFVLVDADGNEDDSYSAGDAEWVPANTNAIRPADPTMKDGLFKGWYTDKAGTNVYAFNTPITDDSTKLYGIFEFSDATTTFTVTFNYKKFNAESDKSEFVTTPVTQEIVKNHKATVPTDFSDKLPDLTFKGWYLAVSGDAQTASATAFDFETPITQATNVVAVYEAKTFTVTFNTNGGDTMPTQLVAYGGTVTLPTGEDLPKKAHYELADPCWFTDAQCSADKAFSANTKIKADTTIYVKWVGVPFSVALYNDNNEPIVDDNEEPLILAVRYGETSSTTIDKPVSAVDPNKVFVGWFNGSTKVDPNKDKFTPSDADLKNEPAVKLVAKYADKMYTVTFDTNGGSANFTKTVKAGASLDWPEPEPTKDGMEVWDWTTKKNDRSTAWTFGGHWEYIGALEEAPELPEDPESDPDWEWVGDVVNEDITLYAYWMAKTYKVEFKGDIDYEAFDRETWVEVGAKLEKPDDPGCIVGGKVFDGWYTDVNRTQAYDFSAPVTKDLVLYAKFSEGNFVAFVYSEDDGANFKRITGVGGIGRDSDGWTDVKEGEKIPEPTVTPNLQGKKFVGWYAGKVEWLEEGTIGNLTDTEWCTDAQLSCDYKTAFDFSKVYTEGTFIFAKYEKADTIKVHFISDSDQGEFDQYVLSGETITQPEVEKKGSTLNGWYKAALVNGDWEIRSATPYNFATAPTEDINLMAKWDVKKCTVTFVVNGGDPIAPQTVNYGDQPDFDKMFESEKPGYQPDFYRDAEFTKLYYYSRITEDITLYIKWEPVEYDVTFWYNKDVQLSNLTKYEYVNYNEKVVQPTDDDLANALNTTAEIKAYNYGKIKGIAAWYTDPALKNVYDFETPVTGDLKLYGKFLNAVTINAEVKSKDYDGKAYEPKVTITPVVSADPVPAYKAEYKLHGADDATYTETAPIAVGDYVLRISVAPAETTAAATKTYEFSINKIAINLEWPTDTALVFNGLEQAPVPTVTGAVEGETVEVIITGKQSKVGIGYKAVASLPATSNYKLSATTATECEFSIVENTVAPEVIVNTDAAGVPTSLTVKNADGTTTQVPLTGNDIFTVESKVNEDGTTTMTISAKPGSGYNFAPIVTTVAAPVIPATKLLKATPGKKRATVTWEAAKDIEGYEIQYGLKKTAVKTKTVKDPAAAKLTIKKLKKGKRYFFRIRTYKTVNGTKLFSKWSAWKKSKKIK